MKISVVIPTFNRKSFLKRSIDSVLNQTVMPFEIIIVDDGSTDGTIDEIKKRYDTVKIIYQQNKGVSSARNIGIKTASGGWVCFLDSDDEWGKNKLEKQIQCVAENPKYKFFHSNEYWVKNGIKINQKKKHAKYGGKIFKECLDMCRISPSSVLIKKSIFDNVGYFDERLNVCEDYELWLRISNNYDIFFIDEPLITKYGGHDGQLSYSFESIEYYRIMALEYLLSYNLSKNNKELATKMLLFKLNIYLNGLKKRDKKSDIIRYSKKIKFWNKFVIE